MGRRWFRAKPQHTDQPQSTATEKALGIMAGGAAQLHPATRSTITVMTDERLLLLGPQSTPAGVVVTVQGIMRTL